MLLKNCSWKIGTWRVGKHFHKDPEKLCYNDPCSYSHITTTLLVQTFECFGSWSSVLPPIVEIFTSDYPVSLISVWLKSFPYLSMSKSSFFSSWKNELLSICLTNLNLKSSSFGTPHPSVPRKSYCIFLLTAMVSLIHSQLIQCPVWTIGDETVSLHSNSW